jgi:hypothetical protein
MMFDPDNDGSPVAIGIDPGYAATASITVTNTSGAAAMLLADTYNFSAGEKDWSFVVAADILIDPSDSVNVSAVASTVGPTSFLPGSLDPSRITHTVVLDPAFAFMVASVGQGADPAEATEPSSYFERSLALAYLCKLDPQLSQFWSLVRLRLRNDDFPAIKGRDDPNACWIRSKTAEEEKAFTEQGFFVPATAETPAPRSQYYWGFLWRMGCLDNTWVVAHSEPLNVFTEALGKWFDRKNSSGEYVGNKLSLIRLTGAKIKPFGFPSLLNGDINENDVESHKILNEKNVGYLKTISDNTPQQSCLSSALTIGGVPVTSTMISSFVNYRCRMQMSNMITDDGTLTDPLLTDEEAYGRIQRLVLTNLGLFSATNGRIYGVELRFPSFAVAKTGRVSIEAASAWAATYKDDLSKVAVSGAIRAV